MPCFNSSLVCDISIVQGLGILGKGKHAGTYHLFYSANEYNSPRYAVGYATANRPEGPYTKARGPILETHMKTGIVGPGGQDLFTGPDGDTWMLFHVWMPEGTRALGLARVCWEAGKPVVEAPGRQ